MKCIVVGLFCLLLGTSDAFCQGKVLIVTQDSIFFSILPVSRLQSALSAHYDGNIITHRGNLPDSLSQYDAIFTDLRFFSNDDSLFIAQELEKLADFLLTKGKLYIEIKSETIYRWDYQGPIYSEYPPFRDLTGSIRFIPTAMNEYLRWSRGVTGYFTEGMYYEHKDDWRDYGYMGVDGQDLNAVLLTSGLTILGWTHESQNRQVVWHDLVIDEHYDEFLGRVICNYFGLCEPLGVEAEHRANDEFSIAFDPETHKLLLKNALEFTTFEIYNSLGVRIVEGRLDGRSIELSSELVSGNYFFVAKGNKRSVKPIVIWK